MLRHSWTRIIMDLQHRWWWIEVWKASETRLQSGQTLNTFLRKWNMNWFLSYILEIWNSLLPISASYNAGPNLGQIVAGPFEDSASGYDTVYIHSFLLLLEMPMLRPDSSMCRRTLLNSLETSCHQRKNQIKYQGVLGKRTVVISRADVVCHRNACRSFLKFVLQELFLLDMTSHLHIPTILPDGMHLFSSCKIISVHFNTLYLPFLCFQRHAWLRHLFSPAVWPSFYISPAL